MTKQITVRVACKHGHYESHHPAGVPQYDDATGEWSKQRLDQWAGLHDHLTIYQRNGTGKLNLDPGRLP